MTANETTHTIPTRPRSKSIEVAPKVENLLIASLSRILRLIAVAMVLPVATACSFSERPFPMRPNDFVRISVAQPNTNSTRDWLRAAHAQLQHLLPKSKHRALLTGDLVDPSGEPIDVASHFGLQSRNMRTLWGNWSGIEHSAQAIGAAAPAGTGPPAWDGFDEVIIPVGRGLELSGRLGFARKDQRTLDADCIVLLPGLFGDNAILRTRELAIALRGQGFHVLALELCGHGRTESLRPDVHYTYGVLDTLDVLQVSEWLEEKPHINRTGLIAFCWGANTGLLTAWYDGAGSTHADVSRRLRAIVPPISEKPHFSAGVMAFSTILPYEELLDEMHSRHGLLSDPILSSMQKTVRNRMERKGLPGENHDLLALIEAEFARSPLSYENALEEGKRFLRLVAYRCKPTSDKLNHSRVPVLIVHGANDPLKPPQDIADLIAITDNPKVAALVLPGGGHVGFAPYARSYYYSLILNFFDPVLGAAGHPQTQPPAVAAKSPRPQAHASK